jgi:hypothetical protein
MIAHADLHKLAQVDELTVSFYLPTAPSSSDTLQAPIHAKNLRQQALAHLEEAGHSTKDAEAFLAPVDALIDTAAFWQHQRHGLALFVGESFQHSFSLEKHVEPQVFVGSHAELVPLLDQVASGDQFLVVALSLESAAVYVGNHQGLSPLEVHALPDGVDDVAGDPDKENTAYAAPTERPHIGNVSFSHGQSYGDSPAEWNEQRRVLYAELLDAALAPVFGSQGLPRVLVADEKLAGIVAAKLSFTATDHTHPESLDENALHALAIAALGDHTGGAATADREAVMERRGRGDAVATALADIHLAATEGRVETMVISTTTPDRLLSEALQATLKTGGSVQWLDNPVPEFPEGALALLRY